MPTPKYSIIIPTYDHLDDCLRPCLESVEANSDVSETECVVVANGCTDGTVAWLAEWSATRPWVRPVTFPDPLGYPRAVNAGLLAARGEYVLFLNNDCRILDFWPRGQWLRALEAPLRADPGVGVTGVRKLPCAETGKPFVVFFCAMARRELVDRLGGLDESFGLGGGEDIDFCARAERLGLRLVCVPDDARSLEYENEFPLFHASGSTVSRLEGWDEHFLGSMREVGARAATGCYGTHAPVTCEISTRGRYETTLPLAIASVALQELPPAELIITQDDPEYDMRQNPLIARQFDLLLQRGIKWRVVFGEGHGQVANHQRALEIAEHPWIWRLDDDNAPAPDVLRRLMSHARDGVGAVAGSVVDPAEPLAGVGGSPRIADVRTAPNIQWTQGRGVVEADHLYSTFVYRREAAGDGYPRDLSRVGHREETIFTYEMRRRGWRLLVDREAVTWHLRAPAGGIRDGAAEMWAADERAFDRRLAEWGAAGRASYWVNLDGGIGDHYIFLDALPEIRQRRPDRELVLACCFNWVFDGVEGVRLASVAEGALALGEEEFKSRNVYMWCARRGWRRPLREAFVAMYS